MGVAAAVGGLTLYSIREQEKRADRVEASQKKAANIERATQANQARRSRRNQVKEARIRRAAIENKASIGGQTDSSVAISAGDSITARLSRNLGTIQETLQLSSASTNAQQDIFEANRKSVGELLSGASIQVASIIK